MKGTKMLYVIYRNWTEWVEAFSTLAEAQTRFDALKAEQPDWNLQILEVADRETHTTMLPIGSTWSNAKGTKWNY